MNARANERKREKELAWAQEQERAEAIRNRNAKLPMWDRIEEFVEDEQLKIILHKLAEQCGLEN